MPDPVVPPQETVVAAPAVEAAPAPAPVVEAAPAAPVAAAEAAPVAPAPSAEAVVSPPDEAKAAAGTDLPAAAAAAEGETAPAQKSLFEEAKASDGSEPKPAEAAEQPKTDEPKAPGEPDKPGEPAPLPAMEYKFTLPEGMALSDEQGTAFNSAVDQARTDGNLQPLIDLHHGVVRETIARLQEQTLDQQRMAWKETTNGWRRAAEADPDFGGARLQTSMSMVALVRDSFMSDHKPGTPGYEKDAREMAEFLEYTGAGNHPAFLKMALRIARYVSEPTAEDIPAETGAVAQRMPGTRGNPLQDHPRSQQINGRG